jgi:hypothetical protein
MLNAKKLQIADYQLFIIVPYAKLKNKDLFFCSDLERLALD